MQSDARCFSARSGRCTHACGIDSGAFLAAQRTAKYLERNEFDALLARAGTGDKAARDELICRLVPLAFILARQESRGQARLVDDLAAEAMVVLVEMLATWDFTKPANLLFYVFKYRARAGMRAVYLNGTRPLSVPKGVSRIPFGQWEDKIQQRRMSPAALDVLTMVPQSPLELEFIPVEPQEIAEADADHAVEVAEALLSKLSERKREVIARHFGIGGREPEQFKDIAASFNFSRQRAHQHFSLGMERLRKAAAQQAV
jgi:RNA polymerase sigma factor (sigma-70 family)